VPGRSEPVAIVGAGPYGLAAAAFLRLAGIESRVFGAPMQFWREQMPSRMLLRSRLRASHIADPKQALKLDDFARSRGGALSTPLQVSDFIDYGHWFQRRAVADIDSRRVKQIELCNGGFSLVLEEGEPFVAGRVIITAGIGRFGWRPPPFNALPPTLVSHSSQHRDFERFRGESVVVVGAGQSALESAALLRESGAHVEVMARCASVFWLHETAHRVCLPLITPPPTGVGGRLLGWLAAMPDVYRRMPGRARQYALKRTYQPAGASWLRERLAQVPITTGKITTAVRVDGRSVCLQLDDGTTRRTNHVLLATGYRVDLTRYEFLGQDLLRMVQCTDGYPRLGPGFESSVAGLHFLGAPAAMSFGPIMRFVVGTWYAAPALTRHILGTPQSVLSLSFAHEGVFC
jgi:thioredoxin reductase